MTQVIIYQNKEGAPEIMSPAPGHDTSALIAMLPDDRPHFLLDKDALPPVGVANLDVDFDAQTVAIKPPNLDALKDEALAEARSAAIAVRHQIAGTASTERAVGWVLKALFAGVWQINDQAPNPLLKPLADVAAAGFGIETDLTGENPADVRDRSVEKAGGFFTALQLVEGMERVAENQISAAETPEALAQTVTQLRALEAQALTKLSALQSG